MKRSVHGFTLAEILVSVSIIMLLSALMFSSYRTALSSAKVTVCVSNLRQLHAAMALYNEDFGKFPPMAEDWPGLRPYLGNAELVCPMRDIAQSTTPKRMRTSYFIHAFFEGLGAKSHEADAKCMETRGPEYPIAHDANHINSVVSRSAGSRFFLFVRLDGSVHRRSASEMDLFFLKPDSFACPAANFWSNF